MKKILAALLAMLLLFAMVACGDTPANPDDTKADDTTAATDDTTKAPDSAIDYSNVKIGLICLHDENSTYDNNFIQALYEVQKDLNLSNDQVLVKTNIAESDACYNTAAEFADAGCQIVFADSFGHESYMIQAAEEFPEVEFCHATGTQAKQVKLDNYHNAFASIYEGRYLAGIAAGAKLNEMIEAGTIKPEEAVIGYVGAFDYAEVVSGMTSFFLGARSVCETATMKVTYTNSWFDIALEREAAIALMDAGCVLISQHADSEGAPKACEERNVPNVAYNISTISIAPNTALISSKIDWAPYFRMIIDAVAQGNSFDTDYCGSIATGSVKLTELNDKVAAAGTQEAIDAAYDQFVAGTLHVFDTSKFTVNGETLTEYLADVDGDYVGEINVIADGYFQESADQFRSAPFFDIKYIDGVSEK